MCLVLICLCCWLVRIWFGLMLVGLVLVYSCLRCWLGFWVWLFVIVRILCRIFSC